MSGEAHGSPGEVGGTERCDPHGAVCITCGDVAVALRVLAPGEEPGLALCADAEGREEAVEVTLLAPVAPGERLLVHAGTAIARLDDEDGAAAAPAEAEGA